MLKNVKATRIPTSSNKPPYYQYVFTTSDGVVFFNLDRAMDHEEKLDNVDIDTCNEDIIE